MQSWEAALRRSVAEVGTPILGLAGPFAESGVVSGHAIGPAAHVTLLYSTPSGRIEVTNGRRPLGGTSNLLRLVTLASMPAKPHLPWTVAVDERLAVLAVASVPTQFRVIASSAGCWVAAGGFRKRHLLLAGSEGTRIDDLTLDHVSIATG